ncbi:DUF3500 domain-containing protein [Roseivirga sp. BDSF3-8]|uniref:DUF3500 domain-containing protein n=1 Tax=Roseivirga sp. BDSF3-8 TaxID=3241598 RepID=UPI00353204F9
MRKFSVIVTFLITACLPCVGQTIQDINHEGLALYERLSGDSDLTDVFIAFDDPLRKEWSVIPANGRGVSLERMNSFRTGLDTLLAAVFKEHVQKQLHKLMEAGGPQNFYFAFYGIPDSKKPWGFSLEGSHLSVNITIKGRHFSYTPMLVGAKPARSAPDGEGEVERALAEEEERPVALLNLLSEEQRKEAITSNQSPGQLRYGLRDVLQYNLEGLQYGEVESELDQVFFYKTFSAHVERVHPELSDPVYDRSLDINQGEFQISWKGSDKLDEDHYYMIATPKVLVEYLNKSDSNEALSVLREKSYDFGKEFVEVKEKKLPHGVYMVDYVRSSNEYFHSTHAGFQLYSFEDNGRLIRINPGSDNAVLMYNDSIIRYSLQYYEFIDLKYHWEDGHLIGKSKLPESEVKYSFSPMPGVEDMPDLYVQQAYSLQNSFWYIESDDQSALNKAMVHFIDDDTYTVQFAEPRENGDLVRDGVYYTKVYEGYMVLALKDNYSLGEDYFLFFYQADSEVLKAKGVESIDELIEVKTMDYELNKLPLPTDRTLKKIRSKIIGEWKFEGNVPANNSEDSLSALKYSIQFQDDGKISVAYETMLVDSSGRARRFKGWEKGRWKLSVTGEYLLVDYNGFEDWIRLSNLAGNTMKAQVSLENRKYVTPLIKIDVMLEKETFYQYYIAGFMGLSLVAFGVVKVRRKVKKKKKVSD